MEREIKFRVFRKSDRLMRYLDNQMFLHSGGAVGWTENEGYIDDSPNYDEDFALMQYTGLKDKNGKEIYEGDIILTDQVVEWVDDSNARPDQERGCYGIQNGKYNLSAYREQEDFEVIGNVYENPELVSKLLKEK